MPHPEKILTDKAEEHPCSMNWPPSRGPEPEWITREADRCYTQPKIVGDKLNVRSEEGHEEEAARLDKLVWHAVWAQVVDLLKAGPTMCDRLVVGASLVSSGEHGEAVPPRAQTMKYLELAHPGIGGRPLRSTLSYPLKCEVEVEIEPYTLDFHWRPEGDPNRLRKDMTLGWVLWSLARAYELIYAEHEKYGVWGHSIRDLCFEGIAFQDDRVYVMVGS